MIYLFVEKVFSEKIKLKKKGGERYASKKESGKESYKEGDQKSGEKGGS